MELAIELKDDEVSWKYEIGIRQEPRGRLQPQLSFERVWKNGKPLVSRPDDQDRSDPARLTQTFLEQINANKGFREMVVFFDRILYLHLVPQLLIWRMQKSRKRQVLIITHSADLLNDPGIRADEVILLQPKGNEGTEVVRADTIEEIRLLIEGGLTIAETVLPRTKPQKVEQLSLFE